MTFGAKRLRAGYSVKAHAFTGVDKSVVHSTKGYVRSPKMTGFLATLTEGQLANVLADRQDRDLGDPAYSRRKSG